MAVNLAIELEDRVNGNGRHGVLVDAPMPDDVSQDASHGEAAVGGAISVPPADATEDAAPTEDIPAGTAEQPDQDAEAARLAAVVESMLLASGAPVPLARLTDALDGPGRSEVVAALRLLGDTYERDGRGLRVVYVAGGYQLRSAPEHGHWVRRLLGGRPPRLSRAMLETLAIVAYRQPCTRPEIEAIRGVDADAVVNTLLERRLIRIQGRKDAPGRPILYGTTKDFLEVFGLPDLQALPALGELGDGAEALLARAGAAGEDGGEAAADVTAPAEGASLMDAPADAGATEACASEPESD